MASAPPSRCLKRTAAFAIVYFGWGSTYLAIRIALETLPPFALAATRFLLAGAALYAFARTFGAKAPTLRHWSNAALTGLALFFVGNGAVVWAERTVASGLVALLTATVPLLVALMESFSGNGARLTPHSLVGLVGGLLGVALLVGPAATGGVPVLEASLVLGASVFWAAGSLFARGMARPESASLTAAMQMLAGGIGLAAAATFRGEWSAIVWETVSTRSVLAVAYLAVVGSIVSFSAYMWLLRNVPSDRASTYAYVNPVVAIVLGYFLGHEALDGRRLAAATVIVLSVGLTLSARRLPLPRLFAHASPRRASAS
jgi:drug/metabolite transporter (DMT)-like permease